MRSRIATTLAAVAVLIAAAPAGAQVGGSTIGPDYVTSSNVEYLGFLKADIGQTTGARIVGKKLYVTSAKNIAIYDISDPAKPNPIGNYKVNLSWENEEVPTNGRILGTSADWFAVGTTCLITTGCQQLFDVRDPGNIKELPGLPDNDDHTAECVEDCDYLFGSKGNISDLRGVLDGATPKVIGNWQTLIKSQMAERGFKNGVGNCHHIREIRRGYLFAACQPFAFFRVVPEDGDDASILNPVVEAVGGNSDGRFVHSARWPNQGTDKFALVGGEANFSEERHPGTQCDGGQEGDTTVGDVDSAFTVVEAPNASHPGRFSAPLDEYRAKNGTYVDGNTPTEIAGCSVHWYQEHPSFKNGGLVALAAYDNGIRFLQVAPDGKITEQGYFQPLGFETSSPKWVPGTDIVYSIDYARGIDILRWNGQHYVPGKNGKVKFEKGRVKGTNGKQPLLPALTAKQKAFATREVSLLHASGWFQGYCQLAAERGNRS